MNSRVRLAGFVAISLAATYYSATRSWHGRWLLTRSPAAVRDALHESHQLGQNYIFPGCGVGREDAGRAECFIRGLTQSDPQVVRRFIDDRDPEVRVAAALALGWSRDQAAAPAIYQMMVSDPNPRVRADAAGALARMNTASIQSDLDRLSASKDALTRVCAYFAMSKPPSKEAVDWLVNLRLGLFDIETDADYQATRLASHLVWKIRHPENQSD